MVIFCPFFFVEYPRKKLIHILVGVPIFIFGDIFFCVKIFLCCFVFLFLFDFSVNGSQSKQSSVRISWQNQFIFLADTRSNIAQSIVLENIRMQAEMLGLFAAVQNQDNALTVVPMESGEYQQFISSQQEFQFTSTKTELLLRRIPSSLVYSSRSSSSLPHGKQRRLNGSFQPCKPTSSP